MLAFDPSRDEPPFADSFNSLFEMQTRADGLEPGAETLLSILYLRCEDGSGGACVSGGAFQFSI